mmetsp:Transcript_33399/g.76268  ORF Transcript_33399/g.76268 Transcript_33399/m.76268 type:complete len:369 (+) Transcript_33399:189-1295(+)
MRLTADNRPNALASRGGAFPTSNEESPTTPGTTTTNRRVPGLVHAGEIPLFSSLGMARAASFPPDPQVANASPYTWVVGNVVRPSSPSQDVDRDQPAQVCFDAAPSPLIDAVGLRCPRATSLLLMTEGHERPERETCPICKLKISFDLGAHSRLYACCMERLCTGCTLEAFLQGTKQNCPNCNAALSKDNASVLAAFRAHAESGNAAAIYHLGQKYYHGDLGLQVDVPRAIELWDEAAELGDADAHYDLGFVHYHGAEGLDKDEAKGIHHWQQAAMKGQAEGRHALGLLEFERSNYKLALEHWTISASMGYEKSTQAIGCAFELGDGTGEQRARALRGFQDAVGEMKSPQRTIANKFLHSNSSRNSQL